MTLTIAGVVIIALIVAVVYLAYQVYELSDDLDAARHEIAVLNGRTRELRKNASKQRCSEA
jgi:cell division protein FtsL